ncbi:MAG: hypothetical protein MZU95_05690 [Desulfomicrobium escambiense]|nr:hypothetical protein [Desulfomicrobium escambiense]
MLGYWVRHFLLAPVMGSDFRLSGFHYLASGTVLGIVQIALMSIFGAYRREFGLGKVEEVAAILRAAFMGTVITSRSLSSQGSFSSAGSSCCSLSLRRCLRKLLAYNVQTPQPEPRPPPGTPKEGGDVRHRPSGQGACRVHDFQGATALLGRWLRCPCILALRGRRDTNPGFNRLGRLDGEERHQGPGGGGPVALPRRTGRSPSPVRTEGFLVPDGRRPLHHGQPYLETGEHGRKHHG